MRKHKDEARRPLFLRVLGEGACRLKMGISLVVRQYRSRSEGGHSPSCPPFFVDAPLSVFYNSERGGHMARQAVAVHCSGQVSGRGLSFSFFVVLV